MGIEDTSQRRKVYQLQRCGRGRQCNRDRGCASVGRSVISGHHREAGERGPTGQCEQEPQRIVREPERDIKYDIVRVVKARREGEVRNVCSVRDRGHGAPCVEEWAASWATWKGRRARVQVEESYDGHVQRVQDCKRGRKVVQLLC